MQMGSSMKRSIFDEQTSKALKKWHMGARKKQLGKGGKTLARTPGSSTTRSGSSGHTLHRFKTTGHSTKSYAYDDHETSDYEAETLSPTLTSTASLIVRVAHSDDEHVEMDHLHHAEHEEEEEEISQDENFSFVKLKTSSTT